MKIQSGNLGKTFQFYDKYTFLSHFCHRIIIPCGFIKYTNNEDLNSPPTNIRIIWGHVKTNIFSEGVIINYLEEFKKLEFRYKY